MGSQSHLWDFVLVFGPKRPQCYRTNLLGVPLPYPISQPGGSRSSSERATTMAAAIYLASSKPSSSPPFLPLPRRPASSPPSSTLLLPGRGDRRTVAVLLAGGVAALAVAASAQALPVGSPSIDAFASLQEPENALSLPTWAIHVSSVIEWVTAMALVWEYGEKSGLQTWKGLCWGMVPLLGGAFCACTWHFFYNSESLEVLVALQSALTVLGNITMCFAAYRIYKASQEGSTSS